MSPSRQSLACLTTSAAFGGAETSLLTLLTAFRTLEPGWDITIVTPGPGALPERCRGLGFAVVELPFPPALTRLGERAGRGQRRRGAARVHALGLAMRAAIALPRYLRSLRRVLRERNTTVIHTNGLKAHVSAALVKPPRARLVWHLHEYVTTRPRSAALLRRLSSRADVIVANSDSVLRDAAVALGPSAPLRRIHNAVDSTVFSPDGPSTDLAALAGLPAEDGVVRIGLVATFARWKGHELFLEAIAQISRRAPLRGYIIGGAVYDTAGSQWSAGQLHERVAARGLSRIVGFTGHVEDVASALRALDIVVHASTEPEPFGMVIAEGMASGRVVVAAQAGGAAELFEDQVTAIGYTPGNAAELAARLGELIGDPARRDAIGAMARASASQRFSPGRMAAAFREAYAG